jgi:hypothetical protein
LAAVSHLAADAPPHLRTFLNMNDLPSLPHHIGGKRQNWIKTEPINKIHFFSEKFCKQHSLDALKCQPETSQRANEHDCTRSVSRVSRGLGICLPRRVHRLISRHAYVKRLSDHHGPLDRFESAAEHRARFTPKSEIIGKEVSYADGRENPVCTSNRP